MNKIILILVFVLLIVFLLKNYNENYNKFYNENYNKFYNQNYIEHYKIVDGTSSTDFINTKTNIKTNINNKTNTDKENTLSDKGIRKGSDPLDGQLFEDVIMYKNDNNLDGEIGVEKCIKQCKGMCVEYGTTGECFCYPTDYAPIKQDLESVQNELSQSTYR